MKKRFLALLLALSMLASMLVLPAGAEEENSEETSSVTGITLDTEYTCSIDTAGEYVYYSFTPDESGRYRIYSVGDDYDTYAYLYDEEWNLLDEDDDSGNGFNASLFAELDAGSTYYFAFGMLDTELTGSFTVVLEEVGITEITLDAEYTCNIDTVGKYVYYSFTPDESGYYRIYSVGDDYDTYTYLYDEEWNLLDEDDDSGDGVNASLFAELDAGSTYCFAFRMLDAELTGSFTVVIEKVEAETSGTCGDDLTWVYEDGVLTISGEGEMTEAPWLNYYSDSITAVVIEDGVTSISESAFYGCYNLSSVTIIDSVTSIGNYAFYYCSSLTNITIPGSVTSIGDYAFCVCSSLTSITIPNSVISIGSYAFGDCSSLTEITIPDSVTSISDYAFGGCSSLTEITIPDSVTSIGDSAFSSCRSLTEITIPGSVTSIGDYAFYQCYGLSSGTISDGVTSIGNYAFCYCSSLTEITIPDSVTSIGDYAFGYCTSLASASIPDTDITVSSTAFYGCYRIAEKIELQLGDTTCTIDEDYSIVYFVFTPEETDLYVIYTSFDYETYLAVYDADWNFLDSDYNYSVEDYNAWLSIELEAGTTYYFAVQVYSLSDDGTGELTVTLETAPTSGTCGDNLTWAYEDGVLTISGEGEMTEAPWLDDYSDSITAVVIEDGVTSISEGAFEYCCNLTSVTIPDSVTSIGDYAFCECYSLTSITIPGSVTSIGDYAFGWCYSLTEITIPGSVTGIGDYAFRYCTSLNSVTISDGVTSIGNYAFLDCSSLTTITIPGSVTSIGNYAFNQCNGLNSVTISDGVTSIGNYAFLLCISLTEITIPGSVTSIGEGAFQWCYSLNSVTISDGVTSIGSYAFYDCSSLTEITIPGSVTSIGDYAFYCCSSLTSVTISDGVTSIGNYAFGYCTKLASASIPDTDITVSSTAFYGCYGLDEKIELQLGDTICAIDGDDSYVCFVFTPEETDFYVIYTSGDNDTYLKVYDADWNELAWDDDNGEDYNALLSIELEAGATYYFVIETGSLSDDEVGELTVTLETAPSTGTCGNDLTWTYEDGVLTISGEGEMTEVPWLNYYRDSITTAVIGDGVTSISEGAFEYCCNLSSVTISDGVSSIGDYAFYECSSLTEITIPGSVTSIGEYAFGYCVSLASVTIPDTDITVSSTAFYRCYGLDEKIELQLGDTTCAIDGDDSYVCFVFTPEETDLYVIYTSGNYESYLIVYDADWNWLDSDYVYSGEDYTSLLSIELEAGATYYFVVEVYSFFEDEAGEFTITLELESGGTDADDYALSLTATYGDTLADVALPDGYAWVDDGATSVGDAGTNTFEAVYTDPSGNFNDVTVTVTIEVAKADLDADNYALTLSATCGDTLADVTLPTGYVWVDDDTTYVGNAGTNTFTAVYTDPSGNYNDLTVTVMITVAEDDTTGDTGADDTTENTGSTDDTGSTNDTGTSDTVDDTETALEIEAAQSEDGEEFILSGLESYAGTTVSVTLSYADSDGNTVTVTIEAEVSEDGTVTIDETLLSAEILSGTEYTIMVATIPTDSSEEAVTIAEVTVTTESVSTGDAGTDDTTGDSSDDTTDSTGSKDDTGATDDTGSTNDTGTTDDTGSTDDTGTTDDTGSTNDTETSDTVDDTETAIEIGATQSEDGEELILTGLESYAGTTVSVTLSYISSDGETVALTVEAEVSEDGTVTIDETLLSAEILSGTEYTITVETIPDDSSEEAVTIAEVTVATEFVFPDDDGTSYWSWASEYIYACYNDGIISGYEDGEYKPGNSLTRAQAAKIIAEAFDLTLVDVETYTDTFDDDDGSGNWTWAATYIYACAEAGIINGYEDGTYRLNQEVTRAELAKMIAIAADLNTETGSTASTFADDTGTGNWTWAGTYIYACVDAGIINGYSEDDGTYTYRLDNSVNRAEAAKMIACACGLVTVE